MNRNAELHFAQLPEMNIGRSKFNRPSEHKTTCNVGDLNVCYIDEILPGDTVDMNMSSLFRMATPLFPVMDDLFADIYWFFVPRRLTWEHWVNFMGENDTDYWTETTVYTIPQISAPSGGWAKGSLADQMGIPISVDGFTVDAGPFKAYAKVVNDWFRDQNCQEPCLINTGDSTLSGSNGTDYVTDVELGGMPFKAAKLRDYFTTVLPQPQKGQDVPLPLGELAPIITGDESGLDEDTDYPRMTWRDPDHTSTLDKTKGHNLFMISSNGSEPQTFMDGGNYSATGTAYTAMPSNLWADLSMATGSSVNSLRLCFQLQRFLEKDSRYGTRYNESLRAHWGIISSDARLQRAEYLGGDRFRINMSQVVQTSESGTTSPQGHVSAYSLTTQNGHMFTKSFEEHGFLIGVYVLRARHSYQQGLEKFWSRKTRFDFYTPEFANLGDMAVLNKEIYLQGTDEDEEVFGYQEAFGDYRYKPSRISGELRSTYTTPLDAWHYGDYYESCPVYSNDWIHEPTTNVERTLAVTGQDQFICDFAFRPTFVRAMPVYSIPGLIDHQ